MTTAGRWRSWRRARRSPSTAGRADFWRTSTVLTKAAPSREHFKIMTVRGSIREKVSSGRFYVKYLQPLEASYPPKTLFKVEGIGDDMYSYRYFYLPPEGNKERRLPPGDAHVLN